MENIYGYLLLWPISLSPLPPLVLRWKNLDSLISTIVGFFYNPWFFLEIPLTIFPTKMAPISHSVVFLYFGLLGCFVSARIASWTLQKRDPVLSFFRCHILGISTNRNAWGVSFLFETLVLVETCTFHYFRWLVWSKKSASIMIIVNPDLATTRLN